MGGGGNTGEVPNYLQAHHAHFLAHGTTGGWADAVDQSVHDTMNEAWANNPYSGQYHFNPSTILATVKTALDRYYSYVNAMDVVTEIGNFLSQSADDVDAEKTTMAWNTPTLNADSDISFSALSFDADTDIDGDWVDPTPAAEDEISAAVTAFQAINDDRIDNTLVPKFKIGMRDIGAVQTSIFALGQTLIESAGDRDVAMFQADLRTKAFLEKDKLVAEGLKAKNLRIADAHIQEDQLNAQKQIAEDTKIAEAHIQIDSLTADYTRNQNKLDMANETLRMDSIIRQAEMMLRDHFASLEHEKALSSLTHEYGRMYIIAEKEETEGNLELNEKQYKWPLEVVQYGSNAYAAVTGGTGHVPGLSKGQSALAGGATGAATGAALTSGHPAGAGVGFVIGAAIGYSQGE